MQDVRAEHVRALLLAPPDDGALAPGRGQFLRRARETGHSEGGGVVLLHGDLQEGDVVVDGVGVVGGVQDGVLDEVLALAPLVEHEVVLPEAHVQVLLDAVGRGQHPAGREQGAAAEHLLVLVQHGHLPRPVPARRLPPPDDLQGEWAVVGRRRHRDALQRGRHGIRSRGGGRGASDSTEGSDVIVARDGDLGHPALAGVGSDAVSHLAVAVELLAAVEVLLDEAERLSRHEPVLAEGAVRVAVGLLVHGGGAAHVPVLALPRPQRLARLGAGQPLGPLAVELALVAQHPAGRLGQLAAVDDVEVVLLPLLAALARPPLLGPLASARPLLAQHVLAADCRHRAVPLADLWIEIERM